MKKTVILAASLMVAIAAGTALADWSTRDPGEATSRGVDTFLNYIDPSHSADFDKTPMVMGAGGSAAGGVGGAKETLLYDIDPSSRVVINRGALVPAAKGMVEPDGFLKDIAPASIPN